jgi:hypothetical protein
MKIVRVKWNGSWNPEPLALERFSRLFMADQQIDLQVMEPVDVAKLAGCDAKLAIFSGIGAIDLAKADIEAIKGFVAKGNMLLVESGGGDKQFHDAMDAALGQAFGNGSIHTLADGAAVYNLKIPDGKLLPKEIRYRGRSVARLGDNKELPLKAVMANNKPVVFFSREDISNAGAVGYQIFGVDGYDPGNDTEGSAYRMLRNIVIYAGWGVDGPSAAGTKPPVEPPPPSPTTPPAATKPATPPASKPDKPPTKLFPD